MSRTSIGRLLVTGGAGFIGSHFARLHPGCIVLDKLTYAGNLGNLVGLDVEFVKGDICDARLVERLLSECDAVVNFAAETHVDRSLVNPLVFIDSNIKGIAVIADACRTWGRPFLQVSTDEVYGHIPTGRSRETDAFAPRSPYSASKAAAEHLLRAYAASFGLPILITRGSNTYGPGQYPEKLIPVLMGAAERGAPLPLYGDGSAVRDYLHVTDHAAAIDLVLREGILGEAYNIGTEREWSGNQVAEMVLQLTGSSSRIGYVPDRPGHDYRYGMDTTKIRHLGWQPTIRFEDGLKTLR